MTEDLLTAELEKRLDETVRQIQAAVRQPSVSTERRGGREYAQLLCELYSNLGCREVSLVETGDEWPGAWGYFDAGAEQTVASYSYFDTYGVDESRWAYPPFGGVVDARDSFPRVIVGRGATVKGSHLAWVNALAAIIATEGSLPVNVLLLSEGAEMMGSPNFQQICADASSHLSSVGAFLSPRISESLGTREIPVTLGYKNMVTFDLECRGSTWGRGPAGGTIYGNSKSIVDTPVHRVMQAAASLLADDGNSVAVEGLVQEFSTRKALSDEEQGLIDGLLRRFAGQDWSDVLPTAEGVTRWAGDLEGDAVLLEYLYGPSINVSEFRSAGAGDRPQLTMLLPDSAKASVELRMVTDMPATAIVEHVRKHLVARGFPEVVLVPYGMWDGLQVSMSEPVVSAAAETLERYGRTPVFWPIQPFGGPWAGVPRQLGIPSLSGCSLGYGANGGGGVNEYLVIESDGRVAGLAEAERFMCDLLLTYAAHSRQ